MSRGGIRPARSFRDAAKAHLANGQMRQNLRQATSAIREKRLRAIEELPGWENIRLEGEAIKDEALANLSQLLEQFESAVLAAGGAVHWARDAAEAQAIICQIAAKHQATEVVKVKSIATDEIELNQALESAGIDVIETDLAELIVQLAGDTPSHILVPAIHLNRSEIRHLFESKLGVKPPSDEPRVLAEVARAYLREKFLSAKVAISGANFGIAETGTVAVFESEGNGRMCLTLPKVLITLMGIEKIVPRWQDMAVFLRLLPRSSTAERLNPYTSFWTGVAPGDGPEEFHLVLLDNGRTDVLADKVGRQALRCIRCSACLNVCPVYERTGGHSYGSVYPGPIGAILTPQLLGMHDQNANTLPYASSLCGACFDACPVRINIPEVLIYLRGKTKHSAVEALGMRAMAWAMSEPKSFKLALRLARIGQGPLVHEGKDPVASRDARRVDRRPGHASNSRAILSRMVGQGEALSDSRTQMLTRIRAAQVEPFRAPLTPVIRSNRPRSEILDQFAEYVAEYKARVLRIEPSEIAQALLKILAPGERVVIPHDLPDSWLSSGIKDEGFSPSELAGMDCVITACALGIAETGTIVLDGGSGQGRRALSLVPDHHICVIFEPQVVDTIPEAVAALSISVQAGQPLTWISGPSATSDIELNRVEGVHGPRKLDIILVRD